MVTSAAWHDRRPAGASPGSCWPSPPCVAPATARRSTSETGGDGGDRCPTAQVAANEVLWIGDSWILVHRQRAHAASGTRPDASGAIGPSDDYVIAAAPATTMAQIANQYATREAGATKVKV